LALGGNTTKGLALERERFSEREGERRRVSLSLSLLEEEGSVC
jgi:hypothetical protein